MYFQGSQEGFEETFSTLKIFTSKMSPKCSSTASDIDGSRNVSELRVIISHEKLLALYSNS